MLQKILKTLYWIMFMKLKLYLSMIPYIKLSENFL